MDESPEITINPFLPHGFDGQRMHVVSRGVVRQALNRPVTKRFTVTDAGFFPHATQHGRRRPAGAEEQVLLLCTEGRGWIAVEGDQRTVQRGDAVILPSGRYHEYAAAPDDPWTLWWFHFAGTDAAELVAAARSGSGSVVTHLRQAAPIASLISQMIDSLDEGTPGGMIRASGAGWNALTNIIATGQRSPGSALGPVERAVEHLRATVPQRTSVRALAAMVGLSVSQFGVLFRQRVGISPLRYQRELRMSRARELLAATTMSVGAVAEACGYDDALYFSRQFTQSNGVSPTGYRASLH